MPRSRTNHGREVVAQRLDPRLDVALPRRTKLLRLEGRNARDQAALLRGPD